jgi:hypothetical protein
VSNDRLEIDFQAQTEIMPRVKEVKLESEYDAHGLRVRIDRHAGYVAQGTAKDGGEYRTVYSVDYGYLPGVPGDDGDPYDVFVGLDGDFADAHVVEQRSLATGDYEQQKLMWGFKDAAEAERVFRAHRAPEHFGRMGSLPRADFLARLQQWKDTTWRGPPMPFRVPLDFPAGEEGPPSSVPSLALEPGDEGPPSAPTIEPEPESARGATMSSGAGQTVDRGGRAGQAREHGPAAGGRAGRDAGPATLYLRTTDVRAVRREARPSPIPNEPAQQVVVVDFLASDETVDDHDSIVVCDHDLTRFQKNPVLLWVHDGSDLPIGRCENTRIEEDAKGKRLMSTAVFFTRTDRQREIAEAYARDECRMFSIGWSAGTYELLDVDGEEVLRISNNTLLEICACPVGSNANALPTRVFEAARQLARSRHSRVSADDVYRSLSERGTPMATNEQREVIPFTAYPPQDDTSWDGDAARKRIAEWAKDSAGEVDLDKYGKAFLYRDPSVDGVTAFKGPHHDVVDGKLVTSRKGVMALGNILSGGRGGIDIPESEMGSARAHVAKHYAQFDLTPPWEDKGRAMSDKKKTVVVASEGRAMGDGVVYEGVVCPECNAGCNMMIKAEMLPMARAAELEKRAGEAEGRASLLVKERDASEARAKSLEDKLAEANKQIAKHRDERIASEIDKRVGTKIEPAERDAELEIAKLLDDAAFQKRLGTIDARRDHGLVGAPIVQNKNAQDGANVTADKEADRPNKNQRTTAAQDIRALADDDN